MWLWNCALHFFRYVCFLEHKTMFRLTGCWDPAFEIREWSNVACAIEGSTIEGYMMSHAPFVNS